MYTHRGILDAMSDQPRHHQVLDDLLPQHRALRHQIPQVYQRFVALGDAALTDGALSRKVKELVALAIAVVQGVRWLRRITRPSRGTGRRYSARSR